VVACISCEFTKHKLHYITCNLLIKGRKYSDLLFTCYLSGVVTESLVPERKYSCWRQYKCKTAVTWQVVLAVLVFSPKMCFMLQQTSKTTVQLCEICRLCLCTKTMFLPLYNSTENLREKFQSISSTVKVSCSGKVQLHLTQ
jgi:hypothetical protein